MGRLGNGQLRRQVAEWLAARPGPHTVGEVAKDLGRSAGAVGNALTTLADRAEAARLPGKPMRYEANAATAAAAAAITPKAPAPPKPAPAPAAPKPAASPAPPKPAAPKAPAPKAAPGPVTRPGGQVYRPRVLAGMADVEALRTLRAEGVPALLAGPPGTGKTSLVEAAFPDLITVAGDGDTTVGDFVGEYAQKPDGTYEFIYGPLIRAMQEGRVLFIDDATLISPAVLAVCYPAMDGRREVIVKAHKGEAITAADGFYVVAGHNPGVHGAVLTEALSSRFSFQFEVATDFDLARSLGIDSRAITAARNWRPGRPTARPAGRPSSASCSPSPRSRRSSGWTPRWPTSPGSPRPRTATWSRKPSPRPSARPSPRSPSAARSNLAPRCLERSAVMSATPPAPAPAWLAFSAQMTAQVAPVAGRDDLTVTVAPGAGRGAPACFIPASAEIEVNADHLGVDPATADPANPADRERYPALWGATVHECAHAAHSRWRTPQGTNAAWSAAATALEESRIEARQVARRPGDRAWLRACTCQIVVGDFAAAAAPPASAAEAGLSAALILAREDAGILESAEAEPVAQAVAAVLGEEKLGQLRQVWREAHRTRDDDAKGMVRFGRRWCRILGIQPDQPAPKADPAEATARVEDASRAEFAPPPPFPPGAAEARDAENKARRQAGDAAARVFARDPGDGSGGTTGVTREPTADEQAAARRLGRALREASAGGRAETKVSSATPPGRLRMRHAVTADAQRAAGAMPTAKPFTRVERRRVPAPPLAVGVMCDVSGSMSAFTGPVASTAWILARATASLPAARTAAVTYGRDVRPVTYPGATPARVAEFSAAGKYEDFTRAVSALDGALGLSRPGSTRILVIVSDGRYKGTQHADGQKLITRLAASGCLVIWIAPSDTASTMTGAKVVILDDPAATSAGGRPRGHRQRPHRLTPRPGGGPARLPARVPPAREKPRAHPIGAPG
jgi:hypothetical protein